MAAPVRRQLNDAPEIHAYYKQAQRHDLIRGLLADKDYLHELRNEVGLYCGVLPGESPKRLPQDSIYLALKKILTQELNELSIERQYQEVQKLTGKALTILAVGVWKAMIHLGLLSGALDPDS